jgi:IS30 family transposase
MTSEMKQQQIEWRRAKVLELSAQGYSEREIAERLQPLTHVTIHRDIQFLRQQAQENLQKHIHETVPEEYQKCMVGMKRNLKQTLEIRDNTGDPKVKLQAAAIANDCYKFILDMTTNAGIVSDALKFVNQSQQRINSMQPQPKEAKSEPETEEATTNGVY